MKYDLKLKLLRSKKIKFIQWNMKGYIEGNLQGTIFIKKYDFNKRFYWTLNLHNGFREFERDIPSSQLLVDSGESVDLKENIKIISLIFE